MMHLPALVTLLAVLLLFGCMIAVGRARGKYAVKAPAVTGHPLFERAYRVQMNTLEASVMFLPALWLADKYNFAGWAGIAGLVWIVGRVWYAIAYSLNPAKRGPGFLLGMVSFFAVLLMAAFGVGRAFMLT
ncbi:MAG: MAPEG family protein [Rhodanobacter sp.]